MEGKGHSKLPPGFRFHPTDEELIMYYLRNQATSRPCPVPIIPEVDIYKFDPWELPEKAEFGEKEWYFFSPRDRKYPNGVRPNRATVSGYWKATGTDKAILSGSRYVGVKKALVFYNGRPPKGIKTDWIMHEYRLGDSGRRPNKLAGSMRLDDWVLCRIYKKRHSESVVEQKEDDALPMLMPMPTTPTPTPTPPMPIPTLISPEVMEQSLMLPRTCSLAHLLEVEEYLSLSNLLSDNPVGLSTEFETTGNMTDMDKFRSGDTSYQSGNPTKFQVNQSSLFNHPIFVNSVFEFQ